MWTKITFLREKNFIFEKNIDKCGTDYSFKIYLISYLMEDG